MRNSLRILIVLPLYGGSLSVGHFCIQALRELGHVVEVFDAPQYDGAYRALEALRVTTDRLDYLHNSLLQLLGQAILAKVETFEPDMVLAMAQAPMTRQALKRLRKDGVATAMWFVEDFRLFTYWQGFAPLYDVFAVIQKEPFFQELEKIGQQNHLYLPLAAQPGFHDPCDLGSVETRKWGSDISFMGAGYPNRRLAFRELVKYDFKIWGSDWDGEHVLKPYVQMAGRRVTSEECVKIYNASKININLHSSVQVDKLVAYGDFVNPRTFEVAACGAFQLVDDRQLLPELFTEKELVRFRDISDLKDKIDYFLKNPEERQAVAQRSRDRVLKEHTYAHRMRTLIDFTSERVAGWPKSGETTAAATDILPSGLDAEVETLIRSLGLPADVAFDDLIWALRQKHGKLSGLETALLFLDEWKKLYMPNKV